jgi:hypothetical protein
MVDVHVADTADYFRRVFEDEFGSWASTMHGADTVLTGLLDRSALYGVLAEIEALGLDLVEVRHFTPQRKSPESGDRRSP